MEISSAGNRRIGRVFPIVLLLLLPFLGYCESEPGNPVPGALLGLGNPGPFNAMSYNVLCSICPADKPWTQRLVEYQSIFARHEPDILGLQELLNRNDARDIRDVLNSAFPDRDYQFICSPGICDSAVFFRGDAYISLNSGHYALTTLPPRYAVFAQLARKSNQTPFVFMSTHFDNNGENREKSARKLLNALGKFQLSGLPIVVTGDFNASLTGLSALQPGKATASAKAYELLAVHLRNTFLEKETCRVHKGTYGDLVFHPEWLIDHVFTWAPTGQWRVTNWRIDINGKLDAGTSKVYFPSDHRPIQASLEFTPEASLPSTRASACPWVFVAD